MSLGGERRPTTRTTNTRLHMARLGDSGPEHPASDALRVDVARWRDGDPAEWDKFARVYARRLTALFHAVGIQTDWEDRVQDTLFRAWKSREQFDPQRSLDSWIYQIARNVAFTWHRGQQRTGEQGGDGIEQVPGHDDPALRLEARDLLERGFAKMRPKDREALLLHHAEGLSHVEAAQQTGRTPDAHKTSTNRAARVIRALDEDQ